MSFAKWYISVGIWIWLNMFSPKYNILADLYPVNSHDIYIYDNICILYIYNVYVCINPSCIILHSHLPISYPVLNKWHFPHWSLAEATLKPTSPLLWLWPVLDYENHGFKYHKYTDSKIYDLQVADGQLLLVVSLPMLWARVCDWLFLMLTQGIYEELKKW